MNKELDNKIEKYLQDGYSLLIRIRNRTPEKDKIKYFPILDKLNHVEHIWGS